MDSESSQQKYAITDELLRKPDHNKGQNGDEGIVAEIMGRCFCPSLITTHTWEEFSFAGHRIKITEATDSYGAVVWPSSPKHVVKAEIRSNRMQLKATNCYQFAPNINFSTIIPIVKAWVKSTWKRTNSDCSEVSNIKMALVLCYFLETNVKLYNMVDKNVIEIGAGTGLVSIVASLLGAHVISTDMPEVLGNLQYNLLRNTKLKCKHEPQVKALVWGVDLQKNFPRSSSQFDYILAADVVYHHPYLEELLLTFDHLCMDNTTIIWAMQFRLESENWFVDQFKKMFQLEMISDFPSLNITLFKAKRRPKQLQ